MSAAIHAYVHACMAVRYMFEGRPSGSRVSAPTPRSKTSGLGFRMTQEIAVGLVRGCMR